MAISIKVEGLPIKLSAFLKLAGLAATGGEVKSLLEMERVGVNGVLETRRGRKLHGGDRVQMFDEEEFVVQATPDEQE